MTGDATPSVAFTCLLEWPEFAAMDTRLGTFVTRDLTEKIRKAWAAGGRQSAWDLFQEYRNDITANGTTEPGVLTRYAEILKAQAERGQR